MANDFEQMSDQQLLEKLSDGEFAHRFEQSEDWKIFRACIKRLGEQADHVLRKTDPIKDVTGVIESQVISKMCRQILPAIVSGLKNEGRVAFDELQDRGVKIPGLK